MKVKRIHLHRFKRFESKQIQFTEDDTERISELTLLVGENGSGKTSILQAIVAALATATTQLRSPQDLTWSGFVFEGLSANHRGFAEVQLEIVFTPAELEATRQFFRESDFSTLPNAIAPENTFDVRLVMTNQTQTKQPVFAGTAAQYSQFQGRRYAYNLLYNRRPQPDMFKKVGGVFWYHEQRTSYSLAPFQTETGLGNGKPPIQQVSDDDSMRQLFTRWFAMPEQPKVKRFNILYERLFPGRTLRRIDETFGASLAPIIFYDGRCEYEISELSAGERAILPILLDFVEWDINHSVILIDELELHLHPPLQQVFLMLLPELGHDNQFVVTTHSDAVATLVPEAAVRRMDELVVSI